MRIPDRLVSCFVNQLYTQTHVEYFISTKSSSGTAEKTTKINRF